MNGKFRLFGKLSLLAVTVSSFFVLTAFHCGQCLLAQSLNNATIWHPLAIGGGGQLTGIDIAPDGTKVVKSDVFGAYIWNKETQSWKQLVTALSHRFAVAGAHGVWGIKIAPGLTTRIFMVYNDGLYRSDNRGVSWLKTPLNAISGADANGSGKFANQKIAIDPANPNIVYVGTPTNGVWRSGDGGATWEKIGAIPSGKSPGSAGIVFDSQSGTSGGKTKTIYVPSFDVGVWRSTDGGVTWNRISGEQDGGPTKVWTAKIGADGVYWCSDHSDIWKYEFSTWVKLLPNGKHYGASAIVTDPNWRGRVIFSGPAGGKSGLETLDNGKTWVGHGSWFPKYPSPGQRQIATDIPWLANSDTSYMTIGDMQIDPTDGLVYFAEGIGVWKADWPRTFVSFDWISQTRGIEELVANDIIVPPGGKPLTASWDRPFFRSDEPNTFPMKYGPVDGAFAGGWSIDYASSEPSFIVGIANWGNKDISGYSIDGGRTWLQFASKPEWRLGGSIAAASPKNIVWVSGNNGMPYYTKNGGATWQLASGLPKDGWIFAYYLKRRIVVADRVQIGTFYLYNFKHGLFRSTDGGSSWSLVYKSEIAPSSAFNARLRATPGRAADLWFTSGSQKSEHPFPGGYFRHSTDGGVTWHTIANVAEVRDFGFGKSRTNTGYPAIFIVGWVGSVYGIWRSDDQAVSWTKIGDFPDENIDSVTAITGDMDKFGAAYIGFGGSGFAYGEPR